MNSKIFILVCLHLHTIETRNITQYILHRKNYYMDNVEAKDKKKDFYIVGKDKVIVSTPAMVPLFLLKALETEEMNPEDSFLLKRHFISSTDSERREKDSKLLEYKELSFITDKISGYSFSSEYSTFQDSLLCDVAGASSSTTAVNPEVKTEKTGTNDTEQDGATCILQPFNDYFSYNLTIKQMEMQITYSKSEKTKEEKHLGLVPMSPIISITTSINEAKESVQTKAFQIESPDGSEFWFCISFIDIPNKKILMPQYLISLQQSFNNRIKMGSIYNDGELDLEKIGSKSRVKRGKFENDEYIPLGYAKITNKFGSALNGVLNQLKGRKGIKDDTKNKNKGLLSWLGLNERKEDYLDKFVSESVLDIQEEKIQLSTVIRKIDKEKDKLKEEKKQKMFLNGKGMIITIMRKDKEGAEILFTVKLDGDHVWGYQSKVK